MNPHKDLSISLETQNKGSGRRRRRRSVLDRITHEALNHLAVASLCCGSLRHRLLKENDHRYIADFEKVEDALLAAVQLIEQAWSQDGQLAVLAEVARNAREASKQSSIKVMHIADFLPPRTH